MTEPTKKPCSGNRGRAAVLGAAAGLTFIWALIIGVYLYEGDVDNAVIWGAVAVCGLVAVLLPVFDGVRRR